MGISNKRRLAAAALGVVAALALLAAAGVAFAASAAGGASLGILVEKTQDAATDPPPQSEDSVLGVLLSPEEAGDLTVTFRVAAGDYEADVRVDTVEYGARAVVPQAVPEWPLGEWPGQDAGAPRPVFDRWCVDREGIRAYDFAEPVTASLVLYAAFAQGSPVEIELDANWDGAPALEPILRYAGSPYRELPAPVREGHVFLGWRTAADGGDAVDEATEVTGPATLYGSWRPVEYRVRYVKNLESAGGPAWVEDGEPKRFGESFPVWGNGSFAAPAGMVFAGWCTVASPTEAVPGTRFAPGDSAADLTTADGAWVDLYAQWTEGPTVFYEVRFDANGGLWENGPGEADDETQRTVQAASGSMLVRPGSGAEGAMEAPKQAGWQVGGWVRSGGVRDGEEWDFARDAVEGDTVLKARWELRLDVTAPVSVGFAVDASTGDVATPDADKYALKSRTVKAVTVDSLAVESRQDELDAFFELGEGADWATALGATMLSLQAPGANAVALNLADGGSAFGPWACTRPLTAAERQAYRLEAFDYAAAGAAFDEDWMGADPSQRLPLKFAMAIDDGLKVKLGQAGPVPVTHLKVTVSAQE